MTVPDWLRSLAVRVLGWGPVQTARRVMDDYGAAGGGLLAGGLTYSALFVILPILLVVTGVLGLVVTDAERRLSVFRSIGDALPPLRDLVEGFIQRISENAAGFSGLGVLAAVWGASHFYASLDEAFARLFPRARKRGFVERTARGLASVGLFVLVAFLVLALTGITSALADEPAAGVVDSAAPLLRIVAPALAWLVFILATGFVYRVVPARPISIRAVWLPAVVAGLGLALLTQLFSYLAPRLIGTSALYGTFLAVFAAMVWLSTGFQILLVGAAWVRDRVTREDMPAAGDGGDAGGVDTTEDAGPPGGAVAVPTAERGPTEET
jgi:membrane protein